MIIEVPKGSTIGKSQFGERTCCQARSLVDYGSVQIGEAVLKSTHGPDPDPATDDDEQYLDLGLGDEEDDPHLKEFARSVHKERRGRDHVVPRAKGGVTALMGPRALRLYLWTHLILQKRHLLSLHATIRQEGAHDTRRADEVGVFLVDELVDFNLVGIYADAESPIARQHQRNLLRGPIP